MHESGQCPLDIVILNCRSEADQQTGPSIHPDGGQCNDTGQEQAIEAATSQTNRKACFLSLHAPSPPPCIHWHSHERIQCRLVCRLLLPACLKLSQCWIHTEKKGVPSSHMTMASPPEVSECAICQFPLIFPR